MVGGTNNIYGSFFFFWCASFLQLIEFKWKIVAVEGDGVKIFVRIEFLVEGGELETFILVED